MPFVISPTIDAAAVDSAREVLLARLDLGHTVDDAAEQAAEFLAEQLRNYPAGSAS